MMFAVIKFISIIVTVILFAGCCKEYCLKNPQVHISFQNFKAVDTDTVFVLRYESGGSRQMDSSALIKSVSPADTANYSSVYLDITPETDWKIVLPSRNKQYVFSDFEVVSGRCNCGGGKYRAVSRYKLNGVQKEGSLLIAE